MFVLMVWDKQTTNVFFGKFVSRKLFRPRNLLSLAETGQPGTGTECGAALVV